MKLMKNICTLAFGLLFACSLQAAPHTFTSTLSEKYTIPDRTTWKFSIFKELTLRFCYVNITPATGNEYSAHVSLICDTPDIGKFDTMEKLKTGVQNAGRNFKDPSSPHPEIRPLDLTGKIGCESLYIDAALLKKPSIPEDQYPYVIVGMIRIGQTAIGYQVLTRNPKGDGTKEILQFIYKELAPNNENQALHATAAGASASNTPSSLPTSASGIK